MAKTYYTVLTTYGSKLFAQAMANRQPVSITQFAVGDGNGRAVQPDSARTSLVRQVHRANISAVSPDPRNNRQVIFELTIPENVGGFWIREMGIYDANNRLVAYANCPDTYKPQLSEGSGKVQVMRMILLVSSSQAVTLTVDDTVIFATRGQLTPKTITATSQNGVDDTGHSHAIDHATTGQKGIVQLTNDTGLDSEALALTAKAGKKLAQEIAQNRQKTVDLANQKVNKSDVSDAVNSTSQTQVASSRAVKTAHDKAVNALDVANSKLGPIGTYTGNTSSLYGQNIIFDVRDNNNLGLPSEAYPWGVGVSLSSSNGGKALLYIAHNASQVWAKGVYGTDDAQPWRRIDGTDWGTIRNPVYASTTLRGLAQYSDAIYLDSGDFAASSRAVKLLNDKKVDKLIEQTLDLTHLNSDHWYPVVLQMDSNNRRTYRFAIRTTLGESSATWGTHSAGFGVYLEWEAQPSGWGAWQGYDQMRVVHQFEVSHASQSPILKMGQLYEISGEYVHLRGGAKYTLYRESGVSVTLTGTDYRWEQVVSSNDIRRHHLPVLTHYDESLVPKTYRTALSTVSRRDYSRRINGTAAGQTHNQMDVVGSVHIHPDGRIVQILHLKHFRDFWFELEDAPVGYGEGIRGIQINLQLWTAMPNKILSVQPQLIRATHPTSSVVYGQGEAAEHICAWDLRKQGNSRDRVIIDMSRFRGSASEHIDMYVVVEGY